MRIGPTLLLLAVLAPNSAGQSAGPPVPVVSGKPAYVSGQGPRVCFDTAHQNFQTIQRNAGMFGAFENLLRVDGYRVAAATEALTADLLSRCEILVMAVPLAQENLKDAYFPHRGAYSRDELIALYQWIRNGGGLLLIADHQPALGGASDLGTMLGAVAIDGAALLSPVGPRQFPEIFAVANGLLGDHAILRGRDSNERVTAVGTFAGSAFFGSREWVPFMLFGPSSTAQVDPGFLLFKAPPNLWPTFSIGGWLQAGARRLEKGRVVLMTEVSICGSATAGSPDQRGMDHPRSGQQNTQFCLNSMRWLSGALGD